MSNPDRPMGAKSLRGPSNIVKCYKNASYGTAMYKGDFVVRVAGGSNAAIVKSGVTTHAIGKLPEVERATVGDDNYLSGFVVDFEPLNTNWDNVNYSAASTEAVVLVEMHPMRIFEIQADGAVPAASVGLNAVLIDTHAGTAIKGSGTELDTTSDAPDADGSNQLTIVGISKDLTRNDVSSAYTVVEARINLHTEADATDGI